MTDGIKDTSFSSNSAFPYFTAETVIYGTNQSPNEYQAGARYGITGDEVNDPRFTPVEGWFMNPISMGGSVSYTLAGVSNIYSGGSAYIKTCFLGESFYSSATGPDHNVVISGSWNPKSALTDTVFGGSVTTSFGLCTKTYGVPSSQLGNSPTITFTSANPGNNVLVSTLAVSYVYCQYLHTTNLGGASSYMMYVGNTGGTKTYFNFSNFHNNSLSDSVRVYDLTNHSRYLVTQKGTTAYNVIIADPGNTRQCYITADAQVNKVTKLTPAGTSGSGFFTRWLTYKKPYIIIAHPSLMSEASQYQAYRNFRYPGQVILADVEELYDQFGYGIEKDPLAIRNFCSYIVYRSSTASAAGLFLIGKGIHSNIFRQYGDTSAYSQTLIPSFGTPSSDALLTAGLNASPGTFAIAPGIPTGRLSALTTNEVSNYLAKVKTYESNTPALWMKNIIHFEGGNPGIEQHEIQQYLSQDSIIAIDTSLGAYVYLFQKTTSSPIQITLSDSVTNIINNGVGLMTFYGHASGNNFDINLDAPGDYNNVGKYPMILALACFSGDIFQPEGTGVSSTSEQFVLDQKGSIGFIAMDDVAELSSLGVYSNYLYTDFSSKMYHKPIGYCLQKVDSAVMSPYGVGNSNNFMCMEMTLHGDPSIILNNNDTLPDYAVTDSSVSFLPANVTQQLDSFQIKIDIVNNAKAVNQTVPVELDRIYPNDTIVKYFLYAKNVYNHYVITKTLPVDKSRGIGLNYFNVEIDPSNSLVPKEITRINNNLSKIPLNISSGDIVPVYPFNYAIIPKDTTTLKASTSDPFASAHNYIFEIDTTIYFNSPFFKAQTINAKGGVVRASWKTWINMPGGPPKFPTTFGPATQLKLKDSTVYYWRVRRDTSDMKDYGWQDFSFQYITGKSGWGQSHYYQFNNDGYTFMKQLPKKRSWIFDSTGKTLTCTTYGNPNDSTTIAYETGYYLDYNLCGYAGCQWTPGLYMAVIDSTSLNFWVTSNHNLHNDNGPTSGCNYPFGFFIYWNNDANATNGLVKALQDSIPKGDYILIYSWVEGDLHSMTTASLVKNELISLGASPSINSAPDTVPMIFFVKKGSPSTARTLLGTNSRSVLNLSTILHNNETFGSMLTPLIGPAQKWDSISWRQHSLFKKDQDSVKLNVMAIDNNGNQTTLLHGVSPVAANVFISSLNAKKYPYLQMQLYTKDALTHTPSQMNKWQVFYTPVPEVAMNPSIYNSFYANTLTGGDTIRLKTVLQNIGDYPMDSMLVSSWIVDPNNATHIISSKYAKKLNPGDTTMLSVKYSSNGYSGNNTIWMEANPPYLTTTRPEEYFFNNYVKKSFVAQADKNSPLLDVTFDGIHILNDDIVSPHPNILMQITSDNKFLALNGNDTGNIAVYIRNVNNPVAQRVYFGPQMQFTPAVLPNNKCHIVYTPTFADGTYELSVQAADRSNNLSATTPYKIDFEVINEATITSVLNYPNPFSTSTRFVFTITGDQVPTYFKIQIITITGKVVREITESELGPLHIGRNITEYAWDGTDQFGSKLANGVYLYRVITSINSEAIAHSATSADSFFTKGWGKMYLLR